MRKLLIVTLFSLLFLMPLPSVLACGGGGYYYQPSIEDFAKYEFIVAAMIIDEDDLALNEILQVDRYFKGEGGEYLAVAFYPPALQSAGHLRRYDTGCLYAGRWEISRVNRYGYHALSRNSDGTYDRQQTYYAVDGNIEFYSEDEGDRGDFVTVPAEEFERLLLARSGQDDTTGPLDSLYPLMRFLNITTESGERYRLNPDRSITWLDPSEYPIAISNDGSHVMFRLNERELGFQYLATAKKPYPPGLNKEGNPEPGGRFTFDGWLHPRPGLDGLFSPNSNFVAVREPTRLVLYLFRSESFYGAVIGFGHRPHIVEVASFDLSWRSAEAQQPLVWSADSNVLAYQDMRGIWLWRYLEEANPQLVVPTEESQEILELSPSGRYVRFGKNGDWTLLDVQTDAAWKNTLIAPDESRMVHFLSERSVDWDAQFDQLTSECNVSRLLCPIVLTQSGHSGVGSEELPQEFIWQEPDILGMVYRDAIQSIRWSFALQPTHCHLVTCWGVAELPPISAVAYDRRYEQPAFAFDKTKIGFKLHEYDGFVDSVDLSEHLDSPIADLEWGQPIFYEGR